MSRLQRLSTLLRDEAKWPAGFQWNYAHTHSCALGLAFEAGIVPRETLMRDSPPFFHAGPTDIEAKHFRLNERTFNAIFADNGSVNKQDREAFQRVTPGEIAARIDAHLQGPHV